MVKSKFSPSFWMWLICMLEAQNKWFSKSNLLIISFVSYILLNTYCEINTKPLRNLDANFQNKS